MQVLVRLYHMTKPAADGSTIGRPVTDEYLAGPDYKQVIEDHLALGGKTHKDRKVQDKYAELVGPDDQILISENVTHYISKIYTEPNNPYCMAIITILDPENYSGERKDNIMNLIADLKSGVKIPVSVVIQALWGYDNTCEKIIRIKGVDFTLNPSFEGAGTEKIFSAIAPNINQEGVKFYSAKSNKDYSKCVMRTVVFSAEAEVLPEQKVFSLKSIADKYGMNSKFYSEAKKDGFLTEEAIETLKKIDETNKLEKQLHDTAPDQKPQQEIENQALGQHTPDKDTNLKFERLHEVLKRLLGDDPSTDDMFTNLCERFSNELLTLYTDDTEQLRMNLDHFLYELPETHQYSTVNSVRDRMLFEKLPRFSKAKRLFHSYKLYWDNNGEKLTDDQKEWLQVLFVQDLGILLREVLNQIMQGNNLASLYALVQFSPQIAAYGKTFSRIYRQVMISEKILGFIPEQKYLKWKKAYIDFISECVKYVFDEDLRIKVNGIDYITKI